MTKTINLSYLSFILVVALLTSLWAILAITKNVQAQVNYGVSSVPSSITTGTINSQLDRGSRGSDVSTLQEFLATEPAIYPAGLVTGFYGPLTAAAVTQFQVAYDLPQVGRVGPMTLEQLNSVLASGYGLDVRAPIISGNTIQVHRTDATISWMTNEQASAKVFYDTQPIVISEASQHAQLGFVSGTSVTNGSGFATSQSVMLSGLQPNTTYYYLTVATDHSGNVSVQFPNTFRTNP